MINLLPPQEKQKLKAERKKRMTIILWFLVMFSVGLLVLLLFSVKVYLKTQIIAGQDVLANSQGSEESGIDLLRERVKKANDAITNLRGFYQDKIYFSEINQRVAELLPSDAYLTIFSVGAFTREEDKKVESGYKFSLSGYAPARETLFAFKNNLEKENRFQNVYFPPVNWVKPTDVEFFVTFEILDQ